MPSTVSSLLSSVGLEPTGVVPWGVPVPETSPGVYLVALDADPHLSQCVIPDAPLSTNALDNLITRSPGLALDGRLYPTRDQLVQRFASYWLPDETVLYIGLAGQPIRTRVRQYYHTPLGAAKPHKGGWWLKTLSVISEVHVHFARTSEFKDAEEEMLRTFAASASDEAQNSLPADEAVMPFANLRDGDWRRRSHGISGATTSGHGAPQLRNEAEERQTRQAPRPRGSRQARQQTAGQRSQRVTAADIAAGQIRIPRGPTKSQLPDTRGEIAVVLRGHNLGMRRWDPRYGPPERSGVIGIGRDTAQQLLEIDDVLTISVAPNDAVEIG